jgi:hypothetical protein
MPRLPGLRKGLLERDSYGLLGVRRIPIHCRMIQARVPAVSFAYLGLYDVLVRRNGLPGSKR